MHKNGTSEFAITKAIPLPPKSHGGGRPLKYPVPDLNVGESFAVPVENEAARTRVRAAVIRCRKKLTDREFATRVLVEDGVRVVRVWRTA